MTQVFDEDGTVQPVTVLSAGPIVVTQVKNTEKDGYESVQVGYGTRNKKNIAKPQQGHMKDLGDFHYLREFKSEGEHKSGDTIDISVFAQGDIVQVSAISKGKGFQGGVKRYGFKGGNRSHGNKHAERQPGSIGATGPQRVFKGTRMAGRMGSDRVTVKNLKVVRVDAKNNLLMIKGAVPGRTGTLVEIRALGK